MNWYQINFSDNYLEKYWNSEFFRFSRIKYLFILNCIIFIGWDIFLIKRFKSTKNGNIFHIFEQI